MSIYTQPKDVKRFATMNSEFKIPYKIAIGYTEPEYGKVQPTRERKRKNRNSHVDWWIYENATPHKAFELIPDFDKHFEDYKKERDGRTCLD